MTSPGARTFPSCVPGQGGCSDFCTGIFEWPGDQTLPLCGLASGGILWCSLGPPLEIQLLYKFEGVQSFAVSLSSGRTLCKELSWPSLGHLLPSVGPFRGCVLLDGGSLIPNHCFVPLSTHLSGLRPSNSCSLLQPFVRTNFHF